MGRSIIRIDSTGQNRNNGSANDSDEIARETVNTMRARGHSVHSATWHYVGSEDTINLIPTEDDGPDFGRIGYETYTEASGGKHPKWDDLPGKIQDHWHAVAMAIQIG